jgi:hypothetical protein
MIRSWLRIALTNLVTHKLYAAINVLGLAVGLVLNYDSFFSDAARIHRTSSDYAESALGPERHPAGAPVAGWTKVMAGRTIDRRFQNKKRGEYAQVHEHNADRRFRCGLCQYRKPNCQSGCG